MRYFQFLEGLASLDFRRDEFIKRKIKQIFAAYFHIFNQVCQSGLVIIMKPLKGVSSHFPPQILDQILLSQCHRPRGFRFRAQVLCNLIPIFYCFLLPVHGIPFPSQK